jgi:hypothetical protein
VKDKSELDKYMVDLSIDLGIKRIKRKYVIIRLFNLDKSIINLRQTL